MKRILAPFLAGIAFPLIIGFLFVKLGGMPVATKGDPLPMERYLAKTALHAAMRGETDRESPFAADEPHLRAGAKTYSVHCAVCHGFPGESPTAIAKGMFPHPPQLLPPKDGVTDDPVGEIYWKVKNGIRLTGMPGFVENLSDQQLWEVSLFLLKANQLPAGVLDSIHK
jgi:thiosulfate dehydrogenase